MKAVLDTDQQTTIISVMATAAIIKTNNPSIPLIIPTVKTKCK